MDAPLLAVGVVHAVPFAWVAARGALAVRGFLRPTTECWVDPWPAEEVPAFRKIVFDLVARGFTRLGVKFEQAAGMPAVGSFVLVSADGRTFANVFGSLRDERTGEDLPRFYYFTIFTDGTMVLTWAGANPHESEPGLQQITAGHHDAARALALHDAAITPLLAEGRTPVPPTVEARIEATHAYYRAPKPRAFLRSVALRGLRNSALYASAIAGSYVLLSFALRP